jgi:hypothetical protein
LKDNQSEHPSNIFRQYDALVAKASEAAPHFCLTLAGGFG